jgi:hypothetical protein
MKPSRITESANAGCVRRLVSCVACNSEAATTAAQIPVCEKHWQEYKAEAEQYLPLPQRKIYLKLIELYKAANSIYWP